MINEFDILTHPLKLGTQSLIEASAGTGKTTALENLVLRLLIDGAEQPDGSFRKLEISEILLVTFTEAATAELVQRVRGNISNALKMIKNQEFTDDITGNILKNSSKSPEEIRLSLHMALLSFDENAISTIHGFCKKMLSSFAFESCSRFDLELITDDSSFREELVNDYWREKFYKIDTELEKKIIKNYKWEPKILHRLLNNIQSAPLIEFTRPEKINLSVVHDSYAQFEKYCKNSDLLHKLDAKKDNFKKDFKLKLQDAINNFISFADSFDLIQLLNREKLQAGMKASPKPEWDIFEDSVPGKGKLPRDFDEILELAEEVYNCIQGYLIGLKYDFIDYVQTSGVLKKKKLEKGVLSFDDLLLDMHKAVNSSDTFCALICKEFPIVMLDEFQDTDPLQFGIFEKVFKNDDALMVMVGDPKQSIYQFRGADIFSYLKVSEKLKKSDKRTLIKNYRSDEKLLNGINTIFDTDNPFVEEAISFIPASSGCKQRKLIIQDGNDGQLLEILNGGSFGKGDARKLFSQVISDRIVSILSLAQQTNKKGIPLARFEDQDGGWEPVAAHDIAILTAKNSDAREMHEVLAKSGIQSTLQNSGNIFKADEAIELLILFNAIIQPSDPVRVKTALTTSLFRFKISEFDELDNYISKLEEWQQLFFEFFHRWQEKGFIQMFSRLLSSEKCNVRANLLTLHSGERRLTNLLHLMDILHQQSVRQNLSPTALIYWLHKQINEPDGKEEHELRLESDEDTVKIMTVHKSKGLQFPIVFCLNLWQQDFTHRGEEFFYHDNNFNQCFEVGTSGAESNDKLLQRHKENLGELIRLTYVALTRAKNYCCFTWIDKTSTSGLAYLAASVNKANDFFEKGKNKNGLPDKWRDNDNIKVADVSSDDLEYMKFSAKVDEPDWKAIPALKAIPKDWGIMSFSAITDGSHHEKEVRPGDDDENNEEQVIADDNIDLFSRALPLGDFPRGPVAGNCIHSIFEQFDFVAVKSGNWRQDRGVEKIIKDELFCSGMIDGAKGTLQFVESETKRFTQVCDMLENVLTCNLPGCDNDLRLCDLSSEQRKPEMQFFFPVDRLLDSKKISILLKHLSGREADFPPVPLRGIVNGFIDLIFESEGRYYIIDWKSNDLGSSLNDYNKDNMGLSMYESCYYLQAAIYLFALHKYLKKRLSDYDFEKHIGGVFYMYVRGVKNDFPGTGVYSMRPDLNTLKLLENIFGGGML